MSAVYAIQERICLCGHPKNDHLLGVLCEACQCPDGYEPKRTYLGSCDAPNCDREGEVLSCYDCGGEFCFEHAEQEHHNCKALGDYFDGGS